MTVMMIATRSEIFSLVLVANLALSFPRATVVLAANNSTHFLDRFNYHETSVRGDGFIDYAPSEWGNIECDERNAESLDKCEGYNHKWHEGINWTVQDNFCRWCPVGSDACGRHHQSPIDLLREVGMDPNISLAAKECIVSQRSAAICIRVDIHG
jgi:hypothetical protein